MILRWKQQRRAAFQSHADGVPVDRLYVVFPRLNWAKKWKSQEKDVERRNIKVRRDEMVQALLWRSENSSRKHPTRRQYNLLSHLLIPLLPLLRHLGNCICFHGR